ncbi:F actin capping protein subunit beta [Echinococcus multilocularis]|uniref:F-actin-capping protein subunit beta n=1 Tax=Echinococcus multilocularis TaxID=6211 RepID=A0A068YA57_ECHMU|nr:F actin capping protein subunit beta [Echinococcus multilocularis]
MLGPHDDQINSAMDLLRRMPPQKLEHVLQSVLDICPQISDAVLSMVDQPMKIKKDPNAGRDYLLSDFNRDGDSFRSPWTNVYDPPLDDGVLPSERLRALEIEANNAFDQYRAMYFEGGISSVYCWDLDQGFAMAILIKKTGNSTSVRGSWDSVHIVEVQEHSTAKSAHYKLTSTIIMWIDTNTHECGSSALGGHFTRMKEHEYPLIDQRQHISNIGSMVEELESQMRSFLNDVYFGSSKAIIDSMRTYRTAEEEQQQRQLAQSARQVVQQRSQ